MASVGSDNKNITFLIMLRARGGLKKTFEQYLLNMFSVDSEKYRTVSLTLLPWKNFSRTIQSSGTLNMHSQSENPN